ARWISLSRVLLPAPEWPVRNSISPAATCKLTSASATLPPEYGLLTLSKGRTARARSIAELALAAPGRRARSPRLAAVRATARTDRANAAGANRRRAAWSVLSLRRARHQLAQARADARHQRRRLRRRFGRARRGLLARGARLARRGLASLRLAAVGVGPPLGAVHALAATAATALARRPGFIRHRGRDRGGRVDHRRGRGRGRRFRRRGLRGFAAGRGLPGPGPRLAPGPRPLAVAAARAWPAAAGASAGTARPAPAAALGVLGRARLAHLAIDLVDAVAILAGVGGRATARLARHRHQQLRVHRRGRDLLVDVGLDVGQAARVPLSG